MCLVLEDNTTPQQGFKLGFFHPDSSVLSMTSPPSLRVFNKTENLSPKIPFPSSFNSKLISVQRDVAGILDTYLQHSGLSCGTPVSLVPAYTMHISLAMDSGTQILARLVKIVSLTGY